MDSDQRRGIERETMVSWNAVFTLPSGQMISSKIYDCTAKGAFLRADEDILERVSVNDTISLKGVVKSIPFSIDATVRWKGWSQRHDCAGFGIEFQTKHLVFDMVTRPPSVVPWEDFSH